MTDIIKLIGLPAVLEQLGEEGGEMVQAALKYARRKRGENPTPKSEMECLDNLTEEIADVELCINILILSGVVDEDRVAAVMKNKETRWRERIREQGQ